jgi:hypothetical protein
MALIVTCAEIGRPAAEVFAYATDPARPGEWQKGVVDGHMDGPGRRHSAVDVLVELVTGSRSRLTISVDFTGYGIGTILVPLMVRREAREEMPANMAALKHRMEAANLPGRAGECPRAG